VTSYIPHSRPALGADEAAAVAAVMASGHIAQGAEVEALEARVADATGLTVDSAGAAPAVALSSGTAALFVALRSLGVGTGDEVLIPAYACASLHQAVRYAGATPRFIDCDPADPEDARRKLGKRSAACIVPHLFGLPAEIEMFRDLGLPLIEDCAQTLGVSRGGRLVGSFGDVTVCSFYATKLVAGGEGGMVLSADRAVVERARAVRDCEDPGADGMAFNFKMSDLHAAIANTQLGRLEDFLARRASLASAYQDALANADVELPVTPGTGAHAWFRFVVGLRAGDLENVLAACHENGLCCRRPVGRLVPEIDLGELPGCRTAWETACSLPLYPALSDDEARAVPRLFTAALSEGR